MKCCWNILLILRPSRNRNHTYDRLPIQYSILRTLQILFFKRHFFLFFFFATTKNVSQKNGQRTSGEEKTQENNIRKKNFFFCFLEVDFFSLCLCASFSIFFKRPVAINTSLKPKARLTIMPNFVS